MFLVGAGPGDPKLLTLRSVEVIRIAEVVMYDRLVSKEILDLVPTRAKKIDVGKSPHMGGTTQDEINQVMVREAREGKNVVRLKGGDPLLFSRGFEEMEILKAEGLEFEIIPGISSAIGVATYAGLPLTHRRYSSSVAIVTGHEDTSKTGDRVNWKRLASSVDTIVVLMGASRLREICKELIDSGLASPTPVAIIEAGTTKDQRISFSTLDECTAGTLTVSIKPPSIIVIGQVVGIAKDSQMWESDVRVLDRPPTSTEAQLVASWCMAAEFS